MRSADVLIDAFGRIRDGVHQAVDGLGPEQLAFRVDEEANSIGWLVWHLTRIQDDHIAEVAGHEQAWTADGWAGRLGLPFDASETGYGQSSTDVAAVRVQSAGLLTDYHDVVYRRTVDYVGQLVDDDLDRIVDDRWDPPVSLGVRLVSVVSDDFEHVGQAAFIRGIVLRTGS